MVAALFLRRNLASLAAVFCLTALAASAQQPFQFPTANRALFEPGGGGGRFFVGTAGKSWESGCFGCVRSDGWQMHEGLDIRCLQRDQRGEPTDPILATADGAVVYVNSKPALSNYGRYIVLRHRIERLDVYSIYAHLREIRSDLKPGTTVKAGETIGVLGRSSNTGEPITKDRAHLHFELNLLINDRFAAWHKKMFSTERNDHGEYNGQNMLGLDPRQILLAEREQGPRFSLLTFLRSQKELCRVMVRETDFPWVRRYAALIRPNPVAQREGVAGYELVLNYNGVPFELIPRAASEIKGKSKYQVLSVNEAEQKKNPCRKLLTQRRGNWELTTRGINLMDLLTY